MSGKIQVTVALTVLLILLRTLYFILIPIWIDFKNDRISSSHLNATPHEVHTGNVFTHTEVELATQSGSRYDQLLNQSVLIDHRSNSTLDHPAGHPGSRTNVFQPGVNTTVRRVRGGHTIRNDLGDMPPPADFRGTSAYFVQVSRTGFGWIFFFLLYVLLPRLAPGLMGPCGEAEKNIPRGTFPLMGFLSGGAGIIFTQAMSSSRTAPYLQSLIANWLIPIQFIIRFLLLRRKPTMFKVVCALVIILTEFICLLPTIFPQLESKSAKHDDGGATGIGAVLWPLCMIASMIPFAITNTLTEYTVQKENDSVVTTVNTADEDTDPLLPDSNHVTEVTPSWSDYRPLVHGSATNHALDDPSETGYNSNPTTTSSQHSNLKDSPGDVDNKGDVSVSKAPSRQINLIYFQFWFSLFVFLTSLSFFWCDILPGFGTSSSLSDLYHKFVFDAGCLVGYSGCSWQVAALGWSNYLVAALAAISLPALMRYSEGANFVVVALTLRTPIVLIFWSLFEEPPLRWRPHAHLGTWLSVGAIFFMIPAVVLYESGEDLWAKYGRPRLCRHVTPTSRQHSGDDPLLDIETDHTIQGAAGQGDITRRGENRGADEELLT